jgi:hypothetical protein
MKLNHRKVNIFGKKRYSFATLWLDTTQAGAFLRPGEPRMGPPRPANLHSMQKSSEGNHIFRWGLNSHREHEASRLSQKS